LYIVKDFPKQYLWVTKTSYCMLLLYQVCICVSFIKFSIKYMYLLPNQAVFAMHYFVKKCIGKHIPKSYNKLPNSITSFFTLLEIVKVFHIWIALLGTSSVCFSQKLSSKKTCKIYTAHFLEWENYVKRIPFLYLLYVD